MNPKDIKLAVQQKYGEIARDSSCGCCGPDALGVSMIGDEYKYIKGHVKDADLGLGCGIPTEYAGIKQGDSVLDLGSGAGNDCFVARALVGKSGRVTGLDFSPDMIMKARGNNLKLGFSNVEFVEGDIEKMPLPSDVFDVVLSNCVLNLVPDKSKAFSEIFRVLKPGGHFCISDVVLTGDLPEDLKQKAILYAGCIAGASRKEEYLDIIRAAGFQSLEIHKERKIDLPESMLKLHLSSGQVSEYLNSGSGIFSITLSGEKP